MEGAGLASKEAASVLQHLRRADADVSRATMEHLREALDQQLQPLDLRVEELKGVLRCNRRRSIKDYSRGKAGSSAATVDGDPRVHQCGQLCALRLVVGARPRFRESALGSLGSH